MRERDTHRAGVGCGRGRKALKWRVSGVLLIICDESTRCSGCLSGLVVGMDARHGIARAVVKRERCVSETRSMVESVAVVVASP